MAEEIEQVADDTLILAVMKGRQKDLYKAGPDGR
jgi:hypothetical protein